MPIFGRSHYPYLVGTTIAIAVVVYVVARWTKDPAHVQRAVIGGLVAGAANLGLDAVAHHQGWWRYTETTTPFGPIAFYVLAGLGFAAFALIGLKAAHRFGWPGVVGFAVALSLYGVVRDHRLADQMQLMAFRDDGTAATMDALFEYTIPFFIAFAFTVDRRDLAR